MSVGRGTLRGGPDGADLPDGSRASPIAHRDGVLHVEGVDATRLAEEFGTPLYVYSRASIEAAYGEFERALDGAPHLVCYAVKANSNLGVLDVLARLGAGFDIVSVGELERVLAAGGEPSRTVFSGVGKRADEMARALEVGIRCFNVESASELERLADVAAAHGAVAPVSLRINPDVDAGTHPYISTGLRENKFGIAHEEALDVYRRAAGLPALALAGIDCHIGSQLVRVAPYRDAVTKLVEIVDALAAEGIELSHIDVGGGQGIRYDDESPLDIGAWAEVVRGAVGARPLEIVCEPGRYVVGPAGLVLTRVEYLKRNGDRDFAIVDAAMNDLIRPALYSAYQPIERVVGVPPADARDGVWDVVGPVCESADFLGKGRRLALAQGDLLAVRATGAYASVMASNYNTRPRAAEVLVDGAEAHLVRERESVASLYEGERTLP